MKGGGALGIGVIEHIMGPFKSEKEGPAVWEQESSRNRRRPGGESGR